jgi:hypothetical protein
VVEGLASNHEVHGSNLSTSKKELWTDWLYLQCVTKLYLQKTENYKQNKTKKSCGNRFPRREGRVAGPYSPSVLVALQAWAQLSSLLVGDSLTSLCFFLAF